MDEYELSMEMEYTLYGLLFEYIIPSILNVKVGSILQV